jgi:hypothetical protein
MALIEFYWKNLAFETCSFIMDIILIEISSNYFLTKGEMLILFILDKIY